MPTKVDLSQDRLDLPPLINRALQSGELQALGVNLEDHTKMRPADAGSPVRFVTTLGDLDNAILNFTNAIHADPNFKAAYTERAKAHKDQGNLAVAQADLATASQIRRPIHQARATIGFFTAIRPSHRAVFSDQLYPQKISSVE